MSRIAAIVTKAAQGPTSAVRKTAPTKWPLAPVAGMAQFIICAPKTNAPAPTMRGSFSLPIFVNAAPKEVEESPHIVAPTAVDTKAVSMCMADSFQ